MTTKTSRFFFAAATLTLVVGAPAAAIAQSVTIACAVNDPDHMERTLDAADRATPELPVVFEDAGGSAPREN